MEKEVGRKENRICNEEKNQQSYFKNQSILVFEVICSFFSILSQRKKNEESYLKILVNTKTKEMLTKRQQRLLLIRHSPPLKAQMNSLKNLS
jgi:predicted site-specific integrase-resolvase